MSDHPIICSPLRGLWLAAVALLMVAALPVAASADQDNPHGELAIDCGECHSTEGWSPLRESLDFDHADMGFALDRAHAAVDCLSCHQSLIFSHVPTACVDCHRDPHRGELGFDCEACHSPSSWDNRRSIWDLHGATLFPLTGVHATLDCASCHRREPPFEYALTPTDCVSCHLEDFQRADNPDHVAAGFPTECQLCHNTMEWEDAEFEGGFGFNHNVLFQLTGAHLALGCEDCHTSGFGGTPTDCVGCHLATYNGTNNPNHRQAGIGTTCENCHGTSAWEGAVVNHPFVLTGSHRALDCEDCHSNGVFSGTPTDCVGCHRDNYNATSDPNHSKAGFGTSCEDCHGTTMWEGATVNHNAFFPLTGSHKPLDCEDCHVNGIFAGTPTDCWSCHQANYNQTVDPDHAAAGFPRDCELCHNTTSWFGAQFDHIQYFPIYSGRHRQGSVWDECSDCHSNSSNFKVFDCLACHPRAEMEDEHDEVPGFSYQSQACLDCHPTGQE